MTTDGSTTNDGGADSPPSLWQVRDYKVWFSGDTFSQLGLFVGVFAFTLLAFHVTGDPAVAGLIGSVSALAQALSILPGGLLLDRVDRRALMIGSGAVAFIVYGALALAAWGGLLDAISLLVFAVVGGIFGGLFANVTDVVLPRIVGKQLLPDASAANQARDAAIQLGASPFSGLLFGVHPSLPFMVTAIARLGEAGAGIALRTDLRPGADGTASSDEADVTAGLRWLRRWAPPRVLILIVLGVNFALASCGTAIVLSQQQLSTEPWKIGAIQTFQGVGILLGAIALMRVSRFMTGGTIIRVSICVVGAAFFGAIFTQDVWLIALLALVASLPLIPLNAMQGSYLALLIPDALRGRVLSIQTFLGSIAAAIAPGVAGLLLKYGGYVAAIAVPVGLLGIIIIVALFSRSVAGIPRKSDLEGVDPLRL
ncbi:MFS transporter [Microbacterium sp. EST19A]|uniref:MFS transporter n=1 Tax=Microbacterium sp. EST19A TaxID=2862681 RepID=UPI001CC08DBB|nr:MFS transporter [Microbacterium sp. EST19A]